MKRALYRFLAVGAGLALLLSSAMGADSAAGTKAGADVTAPALFRHLVEDVWLPLSEDFGRAASAMTDTARSQCTGEHGLQVMQDRWRQLQAAWQPMEIAQFGPIVDRRTQRQVNAWPVRPRLLEPLLADPASIDAARVERLGVSGKGLPALEYLLFPYDEQGDKKAFDRSHCPIIIGLAEQISREAQGMHDGWTQPDGGFAADLLRTHTSTPADAGSVHGRILSDLLNLMIAGLDAVKTRKLAKALERSEDGPALDRIESWRSSNSLQNLRSNLDGLELVLFGRGAGGVGLDDYLRHLERPNLVRLLREDLAAVQRALAAVRSPLRDAVARQRPELENLLMAMNRLQTRLENDIADALKVDLGFNTADGD